MMIFMFRYYFLFFFGEGCFLNGSMDANDDGKKWLRRLDISNLWAPWMNGS